MIDIQKANELIPQLLTNSKEFTRSLNNRIKVNSIFNEYDVNINKKFSKYVNMSNLRYKSVKSGNRLENILRIQKKSYIDLAEKINENDVVKNYEEIEDEKKKLEKNNNQKKYKELADIRKKLRISTKNFTKAEIRKRELLNEKIKDRQYCYTFHNNKKITQNLTTNSSQKETKERRKIISDKKEPLEEKQQFVSQLMTEDQDYITTHIGEYQKFLNVLKQSTKEGKNIKIQKNYVDGQPNLFLTDKFNLLSFKEIKKEVQTKKKEEDISVDINKLMRYTKKGKEMLKRLHYKEEDSSPVILQTEPNSSMKLDTVSVLITEANNCLYLDEKLNQKKENLDMFLKSVYLPNIDEYETNSNSQFVVTGANSTINMLKQRKSKIETTTTKGRRNLADDFRRIFENKKEKWKEEDKQIEDEHKLEQLKLVETNNFLKTVKSIDRKNQMYVDGYSIRDNTTNNKIKEFNKLLGTKTFYNKRNINIQLHRFISVKNQLEKEREEELLMEENLRKEEEEEQMRKKREAFEQYKLKIAKENNLKDDDSIVIGDKEDYVFEAHKPVINQQQEYNNFISFKEEYKKRYLTEHSCSVPTKRKNDKKGTWHPLASNKSSILNIDPSVIIDRIKHNKAHCIPQRKSVSCYSVPGLLEFLKNNH